MVQPYAAWRRTCEASAPGELFTEPSITIFPPRLAVALVGTAYFATALAHLRNPDPWTAAVLTVAMQRNAERNVLTFAHLHAASVECTSIALPGQVDQPGKRGAAAVAVRALNHAYFVLLQGEDDPIARAAELAGVYAPAITPWHRAAFDAWALGRTVE